MALAVNFGTSMLLASFCSSQVVGRVDWWKHFAASHGIGVCVKARVAQHSKGKNRDSVSVQSYI